MLRHYHLDIRATHTTRRAATVLLLHDHLDVRATHTARRAATVLLKQGGILRHYQAADPAVMTATA